MTGLQAGICWLNNEWTVRAMEGQPIECKGTVNNALAIAVMDLSKATYKRWSSVYGEY